MLRIGRIDYLNVWPLFQGLRMRMEPDVRDQVRLVAGHPSELNVALASGELDIAPSSSFEYLLHAQRYNLLPDLSICSHGSVRSVLLACPFSPREMPDRLAGGLQVGLSSASASSVALLQVLWRFFWKWPEPEWVELHPGEGLATGRPFLEIGDLALRLSCEMPPGWHLVDLGQAWRDFTNLPFVFGVWMVRRDLTAQTDQLLDHVVKALHAAANEFTRDPCAAATQIERPTWLPVENLKEYWQCIRYSFGPQEQAGLMLFGDYIRRLGRIPAVPGLSWSVPMKRDKHLVA
ncbi:chorismate dehydratase [Desulfonatronum thiosulfatophilum]|uniref:Chorismate dehydratase n=1 Tax=Desulfonatronum thiosulfatophilum TaxID=617002 RepID=A0A1G6AYT2_9BACT|nr:menaquinone biosynthesis protein [Desulfonatronum thiosulfatophilum]SDB13532.1 chorismate dehydratase [Desulfonatronum thiosulfatophilum]